ncbi:WD40 repeat domain-containing protein [Nannocystis sp. SCPEA4]|uniref:WD40 repeat domain-containing protein n=1 Tax=Nannocystis sp. SCPEA4 TaxID=2996787 RepID=UPI00226F44F6|nr:WD40 repeat domain-containing protein [Nannocystis sp. SCPEA4]MCY1055571.1 WD40 repeat domain-containing protein [Nannocystis sp. SCPEA4]
MRSIALAFLLGSLGTCGSRPTEAPAAEEGVPVAVVPQSVVVGDVNAATRAGCAAAACWREQAGEAARLGAVDVGAAHLGRAYALERGEADLFAWVDALVDGGGSRAARAALDEGRAAAAQRGDAGLVARIDARIAALPAIAARTSELSGSLRRAYDSELAGRFEDAANEFAQALQAGGEPRHLVRAADLQWRRGDPAGARRWWSRARARLHDLGATIDVVAVETWFTTQVLWQPNGLALVRRFTPAFDYEAQPAGVLDLVGAAAGAPLARRLHFAGPAEVVGLSGDGLTLVRDEDKALVFQDMSSETVLVRTPPQAERVHAIAVVGSGADLRVLAAHGDETVLWSASGEALRRFSLTGTTPTITRVYTGEGSYHKNILRDSPTWPVSLALTPDAGRIAIGGSDGKVHLFDGKRDRPRELAFAWKYVERRHRGANPDLNSPLALRFSPDGARLVAVHEHGDVLIWNARTGAKLKHIPPTCGVKEARLWANRYAGPDEPERAATREEREDCGRAVIAALSPDATLAATGGGLTGLRLRDAATGKPLALHLGDDLPDGSFAAASSGAVAMADIYGAVSLLQPGGALQALTPKSRSGPVLPWISRDGRVLAQFSINEPAAAWDLVARRPLALTRGDKERVLALSPTAARVAVHTGDAVELRDVAAGTTLARVPTRASPFGSQAQFAGTSGHVLLALEAERGRTFELVELPAGTRRPLAIEGDVSVKLAGDGRHVATWRRDLPLKLLRVADGKEVASLDDRVESVAFAPDGKLVAWVQQLDREQPGAKLRARRLDGAGDIQEIDLDAWTSWLTVAGDEVLVLRQDNTLTRWRPGTGARVDLKHDALAGKSQVAVAEDGKHLFLTRYGSVQVYADDAGLTPRVTVVALLSGGWLAVARTGAMDGSADAPEHLIARVRGAGDDFVASGRLVWDGVQVAGLVERALAGEDVAPPLRIGH